MWPLSLSSHNNSQKNDKIDEFTPKNSGIHLGPQIKQILHSVKPIRESPSWLKCGASMLTSRMPRGSLCDIHTCKETMDSCYLILGYLHLRKVGTRRQFFLTSSSAMVTYTVSKNDHSLFGYIDIDGIIYEIFLIPANHCHVLSLCMSIIVALRLFIVHMN